MTALNMPVSMQGPVGPQGPPGPTGPGGQGDAVIRTVTQASHGFAVGELLRLNTSGVYVRAQANSEPNAEVIGIVRQVVDSANFVLQLYGYITGLTGLSAGWVYYLSPTVAGALTSTEPTVAFQASKPVLVADTTTSGWFFNWRGNLIPDVNPNPRGLQFYGQIVANTAAVSAETTIPGMAVTFDKLSAGRRYRLAANLMLQGSVAGAELRASLWNTQPVTDIRYMFRDVHCGIANRAYGIYVEAIYKPTVDEIITLEVTQAVAQGGGTVLCGAGPDVPAYFLIEDIGANA